MAGDLFDKMRVTAGPRHADEQARGAAIVRSSRANGSVTVAEVLAGIVHHAVETGDRSDGLFSAAQEPGAPSKPTRSGTTGLKSRQPGRCSRSSIVAGLPFRSTVSFFCPGPYPARSHQVAADLGVTDRALLRAAELVTIRYRAESATGNTASRVTCGCLLEDRC